MFCVFAPRGQAQHCWLNQTQNHSCVLLMSSKSIGYSILNVSTNPKYICKYCSSESQTVDKTVIMHHFKCLKLIMVIISLAMDMVHMSVNVKNQWEAVRYYMIGTTINQPTLQLLKTTSFSLKL